MKFIVIASILILAITISSYITIIIEERKNTEISTIAYSENKWNIQKSAKLAKCVAGDKIANSTIYYSKQYKIPIYVSYALMETESTFNHNAYSNWGCVGLMQVSPFVLDEFNRENNTMLTLYDMYDVDKNIMVGLWYFNRLQTHYLKDYKNLTYSDLYIAYNVGPTYFINNSEELYNGVYKGNTYNALKRWEKYYNKYYLYFS